MRWLPPLMLACLTSCADAPPKGAVYACSGTLCPVGYLCREGYCFPLGGDGGCIAKQCEENACGTFSDGCDGTLQCGPCAAPSTCGGGGTPNVCGCAGDPDSVLCANVACGPVVKMDRCNVMRTVDCGTCGCVPETNTAFCSRQNARCGTLVGKDNCNAVRNGKCGDCQGCEADGGTCCLVRGQSCIKDAECCDGRSCFNGRCERLDGGN